MSGICRGYPLCTREALSPGGWCRVCAALPPEVRLAAIPRPSVDEHFMELCRVVAKRATCRRGQVGAVVARDGIQLVAGYNGSIRGAKHCTDAGEDCILEDGHCIATVHAEDNALTHAARYGIAVDGATLYTTWSPCWPCFKRVANAGIVRVVFGEAYRFYDTPGGRRVIEHAGRLDIKLVDLSRPEF